LVLADGFTPFISFLKENAISGNNADKLVDSSSDFAKAYRKRSGMMMIESSKRVGEEGLIRISE
jgi:hypothetical protein